MGLHVKSEAISISASIVSASATIPVSGQSLPYIRVVNGSTALCYVNTGTGSATATNANIAVPPSVAITFRKGDSLVSAGFYDDTVAVLLSAGTGTVSVSSVDYPGEPD